MVSERIRRQIDRFLDEVEEAVTQGDWRVAEDRARKVLARDPEDTDALTYVAAADRALNDSAPTTTPSLPLPRCPQPPIPARVSPRPLPMAATR